jgi:hypothetical protein
MLAIFRPLTYKKQVEGFDFKHIKNMKIYEVKPRFNVPAFSEIPDLVDFFMSQK